MDTSQWPQGIGVVKTVEPSKTAQERKPRPQKEQAVNCPRCNSTNTKFCYYNNYSLSQPRYFCKTCRRYWTEGGSLRNVPVGGGSRKNKRSSFNNNPSYSNNNSSSSTSSSSKKLPDLTTPKINEPHHDLNFSNISEFMALPFGHENKGLHLMNPNSTTSFLEANALFSSTTGLPNLHDLKPTLNFSLDHGYENNGYGNLQGAGQEITGAKLFFPLDDLKTVSTDPNDHHEFEQNKGHHHQAAEANGFWNGMLGGGSSW